MKLGSMKVVKNTNPRPNASINYIALWVEDENGENQRCLMFRKSDIDKFPSFSFPPSLKAEERMKQGRLYLFSCGSVEFYVVKFVMGEDEMIVKLTDKKIEQAERLATMNPDDIPEMD